MTTRTHLAGALAVMAGLLHWSCDDQPATPTVIATPTPIPTPTPTPTPVPCTRQPFPDSFRCTPEQPRFEEIVIAAQELVRREHPEIFDGSGRVRDETVYTGFLAQTLVRQGHCAIGGTDDEISIKVPGSQVFSELYDVVLGNGSVWNNYVFTCRPSLF